MGDNEEFAPSVTPRVISFSSVFNVLELNCGSWCPKLPGYKISLKDLMKKRAIEFLNYSLHCILVVIVFFFSRYAWACDL